MNMLDGMTKRTIVIAITVVFILAFNYIASRNSKYKK